jgi:hypothetical protein
MVRGVAAVPQSDGPCSCVQLALYGILVGRLTPRRGWSHGGWAGGGRMDPLKDLLQKAQEGNESARAQLFAVAYDELRSRARAQLQGGGRNTLLDTTVLVHESYLHAGHLSNAERGYFFSYTAHVMRSVIVDFARQRLAQRRGGDAVHLPLATAARRFLALDPLVSGNDHFAAPRCPVCPALSVCITEVPMRDIG